MSRAFARAWTARFLGKPFLAAVALAGAAASLTVTEPASAQEPTEEPMKVLVGELSGAKTTSARNWIVEGLQADPRFKVVGSDDGSELKTGASEDKIAEAAMGLEADAVILGLSRFSKGWSAELHVHDGKDGHQVGKAPVKGPSFANYEANLKGGADYFELITQAEGFPPPPPEPVLEEEPEEEISLDEEVTEEPVDDEGRPSPLDVTVGARIYSRAFRYTDTLEQLSNGAFEPLVDYNLAAAPMPFLNLHWYPGAHMTNSALSHIGLTGGYEMGIATKVAYTDPDTGAEQTFNQSHMLWYAGLRGRIPVSAVTFGLGANYGGHRFALTDSDDGSPGTLFPNVNYSFVELGAEAEVSLGNLFLGAQGAYLLVLGVGDVGNDDWFPNASASGVHFGGHVGWNLVPVMDVLAGVDARMYGFNFNPIAPETDPSRVAGGATDRYLSAFLALRFKIPESEGASPGADEGSGDSGDEGGGDDFDSFD